MNTQPIVEPQIYQYQFPKKQKNYKVFKLGFICIIMGLLFIMTYNFTLAKPPEVEYRYLPRDVSTLIDDSTSDVQEQFKIMYDDEGPWIKAYSRQKLI
tara:strand:- start:26062 stop:26355 length:294 start_codon:yes stop_codon:yes gene_type:complete